MQSPRRKTATRSKCGKRASKITSTGQHLVHPTERKPWQNGHLFSNTSRTCMSMKIRSSPSASTLLALTKTSVWSLVRHYSIAVMPFNRNTLVYTQLLYTHHLFLLVILCPHLQAGEGANEQACSWWCEKAEHSLPKICLGGVPQCNSAVCTKKRGLLILRDALQVNYSNHVVSIM